jgi:hypothetical protein
VHTLTALVALNKPTDHRVLGSMFKCLCHFSK